MAEQEIIPNPPDGPPIDLTAIPVGLSDMYAVRTKVEGIIVSFLHNEKPYVTCVARVGIPNDKIVGLLTILVEVAKAKGLDVQLVFGQGKSETGPAH